MAEIDNASKESQRSALFDGIVSDVEKVSGVPVYRVPREREVANINGYMQMNDTRDVLRKKLDLFEDVPAECIMVDNSKPHETLYRAFLYFPTTKTILNITMSDILRLEENTRLVGLETNVVDPTHPDSRDNDLEIGSHLRDYMTYPEFESESKRVKSKKPIKEEIFKSSTWLYIKDSRDLTETIEGIVDSKNAQPDQQS